MSIQLIPLADGRFQKSSLPERHDPTPEEREAARRADQITKSQLLKEWGWTDEDLREAVAIAGFKIPPEQTPITPNYLRGGPRGGETVFSRMALAECHTRFWKFAARVKR